MSQSSSTSGGGVGSSLWTETGSDVYRSSGNVGIGVAPSSPLEVEAGGGQLADFASTSTDSWIRVRDVNDSLYVGSDNGVGFFGGTTGAHNNNLNIDLVTGEVGLGTTSPNIGGWGNALTLDSRGDAATSCALELSKSGTLYGFLGVQGSGSSNALDIAAMQSQDIRFRVGASAANTAMVISSSGNVGVKNGKALQLWNSGDTNYSTIDSPASGAMAFSTGGISDAMYIQNDGSVCINTTSAETGYKLDCRGSVLIKGDGKDLVIDSDDENLFWIGNRSGGEPDAAYLRMKKDDTNTIVLDTGGDSYFNGGNVGIGDDSPDNKLEIRAASTVGTVNGHIMLTGDGATADEGPQIAFSESGASDNWIGGSIGFERKDSGGQGDLVFGTRGSAGDADTTTTERMRIDASGDTTITNSNSGLVLKNSGASNKEWRVGGGSSNQFHITEVGVDDRITVLAGGDVGIGTAVPSRRLTVDSGSTDTVALFQSSGDANAFINIEDGDTTTAPQIGAVTNDLVLRTINNERMRIGSGGQVSQPVETLTTGDTVDIDFSKSNLQTFTLDGSETQTELTGSNYAAGRTVRLMIDMSSDGHMGGITTPSNWTNFGDDPTSISSAGLVLCELTSWTGADTGVTAYWKESTT